ncbi:MAG TPA: hypothetical protein VFR97_10925 [Capillimicrobium sp.]|nr:hypothetical protein [Capillimicrobium sp.]
MPRIRAVTAAWAIAVAAAPAGCGEDAAARAIGPLQAPGRLAEPHERAVRALLGQAARLRAVRDQLDRGSPAAAVLAAARPGLEEGDRQAGARLAALGVDCAALTATREP